jgi:2-haloacid dehalogenase
MVAPSIASIKILAFDVFGTVVDWRSSVISETEQLGRSKGFSIDPSAFADAWRAAYRPALDRVRSGELPWTKLDVLHRMSLNKILEDLKIESLTEEEMEHFNRVWHRLRPWPDSIPGLQRLKTGFIITTLSNGNISLLTEMAKHAALPWDCILSAENVRHYKPDAEIYRLIPDLFDVKPDQVMLVAAHEHDLQAAQKHGLRAAYVHRPLEHGAGKSVTPTTSGHYDVRATDFLDLAAQLAV